MKPNPSQVLSCTEEGGPSEEGVRTSCFEKIYNTFRFIFLCGFLFVYFFVRVDLKNHLSFEIKQITQITQIRACAR